MERKLMRAVGLQRYLPIEDPESLIDVELPTPGLEPHDLLVRIEAIAVNPVDTKVRAPKDGVEDPPKVLGWDASGIVEAIGDSVVHYKVGDAVFYAGDITRQGAYAELQAVDERIVGRKPATLDFVDAAALPLTSITAFEAFFDRLEIDVESANTGETILIIGGAGGVGSIGIQLARAAGLTVIATASREQTTRWVNELGADHVINHHQPMRPQVEALGLNYIDYIAVFNDTDSHWDTVCDLIRPQGRIVSIVENRRPLNMSVLKMKSATFCWEFMYTRSMFQTPDMIRQQELLNYIAGEVDTGRLKTTRSQTLNGITAANLREAHRRLEQGDTIGKITLSR